LWEIKIRSLIPKSIATFVEKQYEKDKPKKYKQNLKSQAQFQISNAPRKINSNNCGQSKYLLGLQRSDACERVIERVTKKGTAKERFDKDEVTTQSWSLVRAKKHCVAATESCPMLKYFKLKLF